MITIFLAVLTIVIACVAWQYSPVFRRVVKVTFAIAVVIAVIGGGAWFVEALKDKRENDAWLAQQAACRSAAHDPAATGCSR
jgi:hypothetical protein